MAGRACENRPAVRRPCKRALSLGHAERLRKLLSNAPSAEERAQLRAAFGAGAIGNDIPQPLAAQIWEVLANYGSRLV
jgi:DNA polymerase III alpha subunit